MGRPKKDPAQVRSVPLNFRVWPGVKDAIDEMVARRAAETGDDSITGWFLAMVIREAKRVNVAIVTEPKPSKRRAAPVKRKVAPSKREAVKTRRK
jgi:hypothetical protein